MKNTLKSLLCILLVLCMSFGGLIACGKDDEEEDDGDKNEGKTEILLIFDYSDYEGVEWDDDFDEEMIVYANERVGEFPKPKKAGHKFDGWYEDVEDSDTKLKKTTKYDGSEEEITLYAKFVVESTGDDSQTSGYDCSKGVHNWDIVETPPTCTAAGTKVKTCLICHDEQLDAIYSSQNKALGHKWIEDGAIDDGGWGYIALARYRACKREGCDHSETKQLQNLTPLGEMTVSIDAGAWPGTAEWPGRLTDGKWDVNLENKGQNSCAPKGGGPLTITILFNQAQDVDQIAMSVFGYGEDGYTSKFAVYLYYADEADFGEVAVANGAFLNTTCTREGAYCVDLSENTRKVLGVKIVQEKTLHGSEYFMEIAVGQIPEED